MVFGLLFCISIWKECLVAVAVILCSPDAGSWGIRYGNAVAVWHRSPGSYQSRGRASVCSRGGQALEPPRAARDCRRQRSANCLTETCSRCHTPLQGRLRVTDTRKRLVCSLSGGEGRGTRPTPKNTALDTCNVSGTKRRLWRKETVKKLGLALLSVPVCLQRTDQP